MDEQMSMETRYLEEVKRIALGQLDELKGEAEKATTEILSAKREMKGETSHSIANLWSSEGFEQLAELSQFATQISDEINNYETTILNIKKLEKMLLSPYFARIDFTFPKADKPSSIYIGRASLKQGYKIVIHDWRAPVSGMFYRFGLGKAFYQAPSGTIEGEISLKRQYEIKDGRLEFFFDAEIEILDEYLRKMLSQNATPQMKSIVETIQREQDMVIRDLSHDVLIVQGVAGSGKTSIAMHRVAYLMYSGLTERIPNQSIIILSPNNVFEKYISNILPELGEENIASYVLDELFDEILGLPNMQTRYRLLEQLMVGEDSWIPTIKSSFRFKGSKEFAAILDALEIQAEAPEDIIAEYGLLFMEEGSLQRLAESAGVALPADAASIVRFTRENLRSSTLFFDDAAALTYLYLKHLGYDEYRHIRQVVVDEAQDYYHLHYRILQLLFPAAKFTILGDINQTIEKPEDMSFYDDIKDIFHRRNSVVLELEKSFRCTNEIIGFSSRIMGSQIESFGRPGRQPEIRSLQNDGDVDILIADAEACLGEGFESVGIICRSERDGRRLYDMLKGRMDVELINSAAKATLSGVFILPIYLAKGLEFDAALIWGANSYNTEGDRPLLFIACTRALHRLKLYYSGDPGPLLSELQKSAKK